MRDLWPLSVIPLSAVVAGMLYTLSRLDRGRSPRVAIAILAFIVLSAVVAIVAIIAAAEP